MADIYQIDHLEELRFPVHSTLEVKQASSYYLGHIGGVAIDVFDQEPYAGPLINIDRCLLTPHIGSASRDCRAKMELESVEDIIRFFNNEELLSPVPESEYLLQKK